MPVHDGVKTRVLIVFANPRNTDPLRLGTEDRIIRQSIQLCKHRDNILLTTCHAATVHDLRRALLNEEFQIVHISGHGIDRGLILEDDLGRPYLVPQQALANLLHAYSPPLQCVVLNACYSVVQGQSVSPGVPFTIAMEGPIGDGAAIEFSRGFYDAIGAGHTITFAYEEGLRTVQLTIPNPTFVSQLLLPSNHFLVKPGSRLPGGYLSVKLSKDAAIAIKPTSFVSLQDLLDRIFIDYLANLHEPFTYGKRWVLATEDHEVKRLIVPWKWLSNTNRDLAVRQFDPQWSKHPCETYGLVAGTRWQILDTFPVPAFGLATNNYPLAEYASLYPKRGKITVEKLIPWINHCIKMLGDANSVEYDDNHVELVAPEAVNIAAYEFIGVFTSIWTNCNGKTLIYGHESSYWKGKSERQKYRKTNEEPYF
ncbi:MAG TPA: CHAT domain-containing protein [Ktedonobacteraceae bacterium]|nr:CHAT domain-containing protein [Ktedonobacteraceae bacterium]